MVHYKRFWRIRLRILIGTIPILGIAYFAPAHLLPLPSGIQRAINVIASASVSIWLMYKWAPGSLRLLRFPKFQPRFVIATFFTILICSTWLGDIHIHDRTKWQIVGGVLAALGVGITEEFFTRGFVLGSFVYTGVWRAAIGSSLFFGVLHFVNWPAGSGFGPTAAQVISASGFGLFAAGLTIFSGSIYPAVLIHTAVDVPAMMVSHRAHPQSLSPGEFMASIHLAFWWSVMGLVFMIGSTQFHKVEPLLIKWKLVDPKD